MIRTRVSRPFGRLTVPLTERDAVRSLGALVGEAINKRYESGWAIRARTCDGRIGLNMIDGSGCGGGLGTDKCGDDATQTGTSGAGDVFWAQRTEGRTVRLNYDLGPAATFAGATTSSRGIASNRALPVSGSPTITTFSYEDGILTWDTSGGNVFLTVLGTGVTTSLGSAAGTMQALAGTTYTLTVRNQNGIFVTGTVIVPSQADGLVIVDSVGNVFALTPNGPLWDATWCGTAPFFGAANPTPSGSSHIEHVPEEETWPDSYRGYFGSTALDYFLGDTYNIAPLCDWADTSAQGLPANMPLVSTANVWDIERDVHIHSGAISLVYIEGASTGYEGTGVDVVALATLDAENWRFYNPDFTYFALGIRPCVVSWGSDAPYVGLADVLTVGGTTASLRILEAGPETAMVGPTWAVQQTVSVPDIGSWGVARVEPTWWRGGAIVGNQLFYY